MSKYPQVEALFEGFGGDGKRDRADARRSLGESAGVSEATVSRWITGQSRPDRQSWGAIATALGKTVGEVGAMIGDLEQSGVSQSPDGPRVARLERAVVQMQLGLAEALRRLDAVERRGESTGDQ